MGRLFSHHSTTSLPTESSAPPTLVARSYSNCSAPVSVTSPTLLSLFRLRSKSLQSNFSDLPKLMTRSHSTSSHSRSHSRSSSFRDATHSAVNTPVTPTCASMDDLAYYSEANDTDNDDDDESDVFDVFLVHNTSLGVMSANTSTTLMMTPSPVPPTRKTHSRKALDLDCMLPPLPPTDNRQFLEGINNTPEHQRPRVRNVQRRDSDRAADLATCILLLVTEDSTANYNNWAI